jgi:secreted trypsin-like serine protease
MAWGSSGRRWARAGVLGSLGAAVAVVLAAAPAQAITGGTPVPDADDAPWMVTLAHPGDEPLPQRTFCGGALIAPDRVLTAAHCVSEGDPRRVEVHLGASVLSRDPGGVLPIAGVAVHPEYEQVPSPADPTSFTKSSAVADVAIIGLARPVPDAVPLVVADEAPSPGATLTAYGHGITAAPSTDPAMPPPSSSDELLRADLGLISGQDCATRLHTPSGSDDSVVCAQAPQPDGPAICPGDSGGPLVELADGRPVVVGVTSFSGEVTDQMCAAGTAAAFADVAVLRDWITQPHPVFEPSPAEDVAVTGKLAVGSTLTCATPTWEGGSPATLEYSWSRGEIDTTTPKEAWNTPTGFLFFVPIDAQTAPTLTVPPDLSGRDVLCSIEAGNAGGSVSYYSDSVMIPEHS